MNAGAPLPCKSRELIGSLQETPADGNRGLWFERLFSAYRPGFKSFKEAYGGSKKEQKTEKSLRVKWLTEAAAKPAGDATRLRSHAQTHAALVRRLHGGFGVYATTWNLATGLGRAHPLENGFAWHHTLGVPYIAGSGVKGMLRAWLEVWAEQPSPDLDRWFGTPKHVGSLIVFDALPIEPVTLAADVLTPHAGKWYEEGDEVDAAENYSALPADWNSPIPVSFMAVKRARLLFSVAPRKIGDDSSRSDAIALIDQLTLALATVGVGAKTAAGYGRLERDDSATRQIVDLLPP